MSIYLAHSILSGNGANVASFLLAIHKTVATKPNSALYLRLDWKEEFQNRYLPLVKKLPACVDVKYCSREDATKDANVMDIVGFVDDTCLFLPEAFLVVPDALQFADYAGGSFHETVDMATIIPTPARYWRLPGTPNGNLFFTRAGTLLQDKEIVENSYDAETWARLQILHARKFATPLPALWIVRDAPSPAIPWDQVRDMVVRTLN